MTKKATSDVQGNPPMFEKPLSLGLLGLRLGLASIILLHPAVDSLSLFKSMEAEAGSVSTLHEVGLFLLHDLKDLTIGGLLFLIAVWIAFGMRTRIMSLLALGLTTMVYLVGPQTAALAGDGLWVPITTALIAIPLIGFGGGRFSLWRGGWRDIL